MHGVAIVYDTQSRNFYFKEGIIEKNSYERRAYESVDDDNNQ